MEIGIIHLTDLHLTDKCNLKNKVQSLKQVCKNEFSSVNKKYLVISGDIANTGIKDDYNIAKDIISDLNQELAFSKIIIVPGNHDCNFDQDFKLRQNAISNVDYEVIGDDGSVINASIKIQDDFWSFYKEFNSIPKNKLNYQIEDNLDDESICFHCFNTSWMSSIKEKPGTLFFPVNFCNKLDNSSCINISVLHHPLNWFTPKTKKNNKNEFQGYLDDISSLKLIGHEHETKLEKRENLQKNVESLEFSGQLFNINSSDASGFQLITLNILDRKGTISEYQWEKDLYVNTDEYNIDLRKQRNRKLNICDNYFDMLEDIKIPLIIENNKVKLSDIYVFPDIVEKGQEYDRLDSFIDSEELLSNTEFDRVVLAGESQIGKTSLLQMLFQRFYYNRYYPMLINGQDINNSDINKIIKRVFSKIYINKDNAYDRFLQIEKKEKVLLIDDFFQNKLNPKSLEKFISQALTLFDKVIIVIDAANSLSTEFQTIFSDFKHYAINQLGYKKTNYLITKYFSLKEDFSTIDEQQKLMLVKKSFNQVRNLLGNKILPSYPVFILSLLKSLGESVYSIKGTSYGYCYEYLLYFALRSKAKLSEDSLSKYLSFLEKLAYDRFKNPSIIFSESYFKDYHKTYSEDFIIDNYESIKNNLINSYIIIENDQTYKFGYKYIYYYLVAKHIASIISTEEGIKVVEKLFDNLHIEENANILVFITHHSKDDSFIQESVLQAMEPFEKVDPITLNKDCDFYELLKDLGKSVSEEIIKADIDPLKERDEILEAYDRDVRVKEDFAKKNNELNNEITTYTKPFVRAFKSIDIVSQIIKNRLGYLKKSELIEYISELYLTGFRLIGAVGKSFISEKDDLTKELISMIVEDIKKKAKGREYLLKNPVAIEDIKDKVNKFFQIINLQICLSVFSKLVDSLGINDKETLEIYKKISSKIDTPAAKLVSFSIISYHYGVSTEEIKSLAKEFENNPVALKILKARVISYVYNNHIEYKKKQSISSILHLKLLPHSKREKK